MMEKYRGIYKKRFSHTEGSDVKMNTSYNQMTTHILPLSFENWFTTLQKRLPERPNFIIDGSILHIGQVTVEFLGIPIDKDEYYNQLYEYVHNGDIEIHLLTEDNLNKTISNKQFQAIQKVLNIHRDQNLSINRFIAFLDGEQLLIKHKNPALYRKIRSSFKEMLEFFAQVEQSGLKNQQLQRVLVDVIKWSVNHLDPALTKINPESFMPKFLWYGDFKRSHQYFLYFLYKLGCDLIIFHPNGMDPFDINHSNQELSFLHTYPDNEIPEPFPIEKRRRKATVAYRASKEIESILHHDGSNLFKPWQLRDYSPSSVTLKTTYDELFLLVKEHAMIRPNFEVANQEVKIPVIFAKIYGVSKNRKEYWERIHKITEGENTLLIKTFPFTNNLNSDFRYHYRNALGKEGILVPEKMIKGHYWKYNHMPKGLQGGIANAIQNICVNPFLRPLPGESNEDVQIYLFTQAMQLPEIIIRLLQKFDYSQEVPKVILFNNELNGTMTRSDVALLLFLNQFGFDIIAYNPPGHNDIEPFLVEGQFDSHWLEDVVFDLEYKEPSSLKKFFLNGILKNLKGD